MRSPDGRYRFDLNGTGRQIRLIDGMGETSDALNWYLEDSVVAQAFGICLPPELAALADVATAVYLADRLARRPHLDQDQGPGGWGRELDLTVPVADAARWQDPELVAGLADTLWLQTDDRWAFHFVQRPALRLAEQSQPMFHMPLRPGARAALGMAGLTAGTVSCDRFPQRVAGHSQCGLCSSCLLRRQALHAAGLGAHDDPLQYRRDLMDSLSNVRPGELYPLHAMLYQRDAMVRALESAAPWPALAERFPELLEVVPHANLAAPAPLFPELGLVSLYRRYSDEWARIPLAPALARLAA